MPNYIQSGTSLLLINVCVIKLIEHMHLVSYCIALEFSLRNMHMYQVIHKFVTPTE